jgi:hypothetical protein
MFGVLLQQKARPPIMTLRSLLLAGAAGLLAVPLASGVWMAPSLS